MAKLNVILEPGFDGKFSYFPGQVVTGAIELTNERTEKFQSLYMEVLGKAKSKVAIKNGKSTTYYEGLEVYMNTKTYLFGGADGPSQEIEKGIHKYNFCFELPPKIPYSLSIKKGEIKYQVKVVLDIPWGLNKELKVPITVLSNFDLDLYPQLTKSCSVDRAHMFFSFGDSKPLKIFISLPYTGYVPEQDVSFNIRYENESHVDVERTKISLNQQIELNAQMTGIVDALSGIRTNTIKNGVLTFVEEGVKSGETKDILAKFKVPSVISSNNMFSKVVVVTYFLKIEACVSILRKNVKIEIPVTIGNTPVAIEDQQKADISILESKKPSAPNDLPPSFEQATNVS